MYDDELYHHGVKGQRWYHRRYQNYDGSLTQEGYQHWGLNPDGSRRKTSRDNIYTPNGEKKAVTGYAIGATAGAVAGGVLAGGAGAAVGSFWGGVSGSLVGTVIGETQSAIMRKRIRKLLDEKGKVYVKDL